MATASDDIPQSPAPNAFPASEENTAADAVELSTEQIARLNDLTPAGRHRHCVDAHERGCGESNHVLALVRLRPHRGGHRCPTAANAGA